MATILPRSAWTKTSNGRAGRPLDKSRVVGIAVHYPAAGSANLSALTKTQVASRLEGWRKLHTSAPRNWADIGYNFAVDGAGRIWDLTGYNIGAHAGATGNPTRVGVLFVIGDTEKPTTKMLEAFAALRAHILKSYPKATKIEGHQQVPGNQTSCPGKPLMALIQSGKILPTKPSAKPAPAATTYTVKKGDTLSAIAVRYKTTTAALAKLNGIKNINLIHVGQKLTIKKAAAAPAPKQVPLGPLWGKVATVNLGNDNKHGIETWKARRDKVVAKIHDSNAAIIATQENPVDVGGEAGRNWIDAELARLGRYRRIAGSHGRYIYADKTVKVLATGVVNPKTKAGGASKRFTWAHLKVDGSPMFVWNGHAQSGAAHSAIRTKWAEEVFAWVDKKRRALKVDARNVVALGDFNGREVIAVAKKYKMVDAFTIARSPQDAGMKSYTAWKKAVEGPRIDLVLVHQDRPVGAASQDDDHTILDHNMQRVNLHRLTT